MKKLTYALLYAMVVAGLLSVSGDVFAQKDKSGKLSGEIDGFFIVPESDQAGDRLIVRVIPDDSRRFGDEQFVDLGSPDEVNRQEIEPGTRITASGYSDRAAGFDVLVAEEHELGSSRAQASDRSQPQPRDFAQRQMWRPDFSESEEEASPRRQARQPQRAPQEQRRQPSDDDEAFFDPSPRADAPESDPSTAMREPTAEFSPDVEAMKRRLAQRFEGGETAMPQRQGPGQAQRPQQIESAKGAKSTEARQITGTVEAVKDFSMEDTGDTHRLLKVRGDEDDQEWTVDLGATSELREIDIAQGDSVAIEGTPDRFNDMQVIRASQIAKFIVLNTDADRSSARAVRQNR